MAESEAKLKSLLMKVKEESKKAGLKLSIQKMKVTASSPITSWQIDGETMETVTDFIFLGYLLLNKRWIEMYQKEGWGLNQTTWVLPFLSSLGRVLWSY